MGKTRAKKSRAVQETERAIRGALALARLTNADEGALADRMARVEALLAEGVLDHADMGQLRNIRDDAGHLAGAVNELGVARTDLDDYDRHPFEWATRDELEENVRQCTEDMADELDGMIDELEWLKG